ncbi:class I ribonucleotide reductase maintenance protein YfaE [Oceanimonas pelagia]|uniref:Class I ribonucleotide reductase maintenance protein YfaE n=1 Tax=Oceanimonas pelagia TaxID=3028314 RepID=A0AA50QD91_9GAMM|nr:class I ribonucleotide reductase maintenance protein YfaE [Oceanimonas pelagia]WMC11949.1 class I ribonucleotide reductase maintenance protein YfaE [Oceanimonas pelagia]
MSKVHTRDLSFELRAGETLLDGLERTGHAVEYQCRSGYCGACRTSLLAGTVRYQQEPLAFVAGSDVLPCCCQPEGEVRLDIALLTLKQQA